jgi:hypothetical protein
MKYERREGAIKGGCKGVSLENAELEKDLSDVG